VPHQLKVSEALCTHACLYLLRNMALRVQLVNCNGCGAQSVRLPKFCTANKDKRERKELGALVEKDMEKDEKQRELTALSCEGS
jgi:hypothetical protein